ncbi:MAG TPA: DeoR/GlpR family DNA-binding transcription regulator [Porticoccaceae bacterium]
MLEKQRHQLILDILDEERFASVQSLAAKLNSSEATIRRDLTKLARQEKLRKIRGGAESMGEGTPRRQQPTLKGSPFLLNKEQNAEAKRRIAAKAVELCEDGESIIINGGSSTFMMGEFLATRQMNILTNSFYLAQTLMETSDNQITLPGGEIYRRQGIILSSFEQYSIQYNHATRMFMGTPGIGEYGVMESDPLLIRSEQKLRRQAEKLVILADSSKLGKRSNFIFAALDEVDMLITDDQAEQRHIDLFREAGIEVIVV